MNRRELVNAAAGHVGMEAREVDKVLKGVTDVITATAAKGEQVVISGFAKFAKVERPARMGRNPATGEPIQIKASKKARVTPLKAFKDAVMNPGLAPTLLKLAPVKAAPPAKAPAKKTAAKKTAARKAPARKAPAKKTTARRAPARKAPARKAPAKKTTARRAPARKAPAKKTARRR
jgi:DNA-binding protein HU-beta